MSTPAESRALSLMLAVLLRGGVILSGALFSLGMVSLALSPVHFDPSRYSTFVPAAVQAPAFPPITSLSDLLLHLGLLVLLMLPVARLVLAAVVFARERDRLFCAISVSVLALIVLSTALARVA